MKKLLFTILLSSFGHICFSQNITYARHIVDTLTSPSFWGRGYTKDGMQQAASFLKNELIKAGVSAVQKDGEFFQRFQYPVNTFPGKMHITLNGKKLVPGVDFIVSQESRGNVCKGLLEKRDSATFIDRENKVIFLLQSKLTMSVAGNTEPYTLVLLDKKLIKGNPRKYELEIENKFEPYFTANNIAGMVKGTEVPDSFLVITAHYDHLGGLGTDTYFPGANDNASGVSLLLNLARYYAQHPQRHSVAFILFAGEEAGILGSKYYTEHPLFPLNNIRFLLNTDLAGTGEDGITVVNATVYKSEFELMQKVNADKNYLKAINPRDKAMNSDHYWFTEKGIPAFFFYTQGGIQAYHDVFDRPETLPLTEHEDLLKLVTDFYSALDK
ncbi:MAG TPA: M28 family peptidase [Chitinophagales bacterium]|nr:M28 family peptidase [Chitinophagales bacterium]